MQKLNSKPKGWRNKKNMEEIVMKNIKKSGTIFQSAKNYYLKIYFRKFGIFGKYKPV